MESLVLTTGSGVGWYRVRRKYMVDISFRVEGAMTSLSCGYPRWLFQTWLHANFEQRRKDSQISIPSPHPSLHNA